MISSAADTAETNDVSISTPPLTNEPQDEELLMATRNPAWITS